MDSEAGGDLHPDRVPGAESAVADESKFLEYLLNSEHSQGSSKAKFFAGLGFDESNWEELRSAILGQLPYVEGQYSRMNGANGQNWIAVLAIEGPERYADVLTVWEVQPGRQTSLITARPGPS